MYKVSDNVIIRLWERCNWIAGSEWEEENAAGSFLLLVKRYKARWFKCIVDVSKETIRWVWEVVAASQESLVCVCGHSPFPPVAKENITFHADMKMRPQNVNLWHTLTVFLWLVLVLNYEHFILLCLVNVSQTFTVNFVCRDFGFIPCFTCSPFSLSNRFISSKVQRKFLQCAVWGH